ncbi:MAG: SLAC1 anion channel family protein [Rubrivivax sp.]|nr:SLAC1 anion channel family protein [Rubrivivax sp.]
MPLSPTPLRHLMPGWFSIVMGLGGLSLAWHRATPAMGDLAGAVSLLFGAAAAIVFVMLVAGTLLRVRRYPEAWAEDLRHPVRQPFVAAIPVAMLLLATVGVAIGGPSSLLAALWVVAAIAQWVVTVWVLARWWKPGAQGGAHWAGVTPALFIPVVGNVVVPLAGVPLGFEVWSAAQFGVGIVFWPIVQALVMARVAIQGPWPERLMPAGFIVVAPPAVAGLGLMQFGAPVGVVWALWGVSLFMLTWAAFLARRLAGLPFGLPHWALSFPLAAFAALTLRLGESGAMPPAVGPVALSLASIVVVGLVLGTLRGLRDGSLLAPEPVASIQPVRPDGG